MDRFRGVFPATITPMTAEGDLNEETFRHVLEFNIQAGVHGFWVAGGTGESVLLADEENKRIAEIAADQNNGRVVNIMHVGAATTQRAARLAEHAAKVGIESICCVPPFFYGRGDEEIVEHYRIVAAAADLPLFIYNLPSATGVEITPQLARKIQDRVPQLTGLKHSAANFYNIRAFDRMGLACFTGSGALFLPALTIGAAGCVDGPPNAAPEHWVEIWEAYGEGDLKRAEAAQTRADKMFDLFTEFSYLACLKALLSHRLGMDCGSPRPPGAPLTQQQTEGLLQRAENLGMGRVSLKL